MYKLFRNIRLYFSKCDYKIAVSFINYDDDIIEFDYDKYRDIYSNEICSMSVERQKEYLIGKYIITMAVKNF